MNTSTPPAPTFNPALLTEVRIPFPNEISSRFKVYAGPNDPAAGDGRHYYAVTATGDDGVEKLMQEIQFQHGALKTGVEVNGILSVCLTAIMVDHFKSFQAGDYPSRETALMITHLEEVQNWQARRADDRASRDVLGLHAK